MRGITLLARDSFPNAEVRLYALIGARLDGPLQWATYDVLPEVFQPTVIFSDFERLDSATLERAGTLYRRLADAGHRVLNDPARVLYRLPLLAALAEAGINRFRGHAIDSPRNDWRWPVFLRHGNDHKGPVTGLLHNAIEVDAALKDLSPGALMVTEYCDIRSADGLYRKYGAFRIGGATFAAHIVFADTWHGKKDVALTRALRDEEYDYVTAFPHRAEIERIMDMARVEFGRVDYGLCDGKPQVWEINTLPNPVDFDGWTLDAYPSAPLYYDNLVAALKAAMDDEPGGLSRVA